MKILLKEHKEQLENLYDFSDDIEDSNVVVSNGENIKRKERKRIKERKKRI